MLLSIQFPIVDSRLFLDNKIKLVGRPGWPSASPDIDFVRSFGIIRKRRLGGLPGWIGENVVCEAKRSLKFSRIKAFLEHEGDLHVPLRVAFRRFYFDGLAVGKFEIGLGIDIENLNTTLTREQTKDIIKHCLSLPVIIPTITNKTTTNESIDRTVTCDLAHAGKYISKLYAACSISYPLPAQLNDWWVLAGTPLLFLVYKESERLEIPFPSRLVPGGRCLNADLSYCEVINDGRNLGMWVLGLSRYAYYGDVRALRICLLRLHAEHEALRLVLQNIATERINIIRRSNTSNILQHYLNEATRRISRLDSRANSLSFGNIAELARASEDIIKPGERDALLTLLRNIDVRRNIFNKVESYINERIYAKEVIMGDKYDINSNQIGIVGPNARVHDIIFMQWVQSGDNMNLENLNNDLSRLRKELKVQAKDPEHDTAVGEIAAAEIAAKENDGPAAFGHLRQAGRWVLNIAESIGVPVAVEALKKAMGV